MQTRISHKSHNPLTVIKSYTGEKDPAKHIEAFVNEVLNLDALEAIICRAFLRTLKGEALSWFLKLSLNSINSWNTLTQMFSKHFIISKET